MFIVRVILTSEYNGFPFISLEFASFDKRFLFHADTFQQNGGGLVSRVLWDELTTDCKVKYICFGR